MPRTFADTIAADAANTFLDPNGFGQTWTHQPPSGSAETFVGTLDEDPPIQTADDQGGSITKRTGILLCPLTLTISVAEGKASKFTLNGETWIARGISSDDQLHEVRVVLATMTAGRRGVWSGTQQQ